MESKAMGLYRQQYCGASTANGNAMRADDRGQNTDNDSELSLIADSYMRKWYLNIYLCYNLHHPIYPLAAGSSLAETIRCGYSGQSAVRDTGISRRLRISGTPGDEVGQPATYHAGCWKTPVRVVLVRRVLQVNRQGIPMGRSRYGKKGTEGFWSSTT